MTLIRGGMNTTAFRVRLRGTSVSTQTDHCQRRLWRLASRSLHFALDSRY